MEQTKANRTRSSRAGTNGKDRGAVSLQGEVGALRSSLAQVMACVREGEGDALKAGGVVARLCDSIVRAMLAQRKLSAGGEESEWLRAEVSRMFEELSHGDERDAKGEAGVSTK